jgi:hypothetical protein
MKRKSNSWNRLSPLIVALLLVGIAGVTEARPSFGGSCLVCHSNPNGDMNILPDPVEITVGSSGTITFEVTDIPAADAAIAVSGLEALGPGNYTIGAGWTEYSGYYASDLVAATGPVTMELWIDVSAAPGDYALGAILAGHTLWGLSKDLTVRVVPVPGPVTLDIVSVNEGTCHLSWSPSGDYTLQYSDSLAFDSPINTVEVGETVTEYDYHVGTAIRGFFRLVPR